MLRPIGAPPPPSGGASAATVDHPNFTGSNPGSSITPGVFDPVNGPWDVDNDGDGIADSVWVDLGVPVQTSVEGTTYKPLFAIRVLDMDGRLNVNAHGNSGQLETAYTTPTPVTANFAGTGGTPQNPLTPSTVAPSCRHGRQQSGAGLGLWHRRDQPGAAVHPASRHESRDAVSISSRRQLGRQRSGRGDL